MDSHIVGIYKDEISREIARTKDYSEYCFTVPISHMEEIIGEIDKLTSAQTRLIEDAKRLVEKWVQQDSRGLYCLYCGRPVDTFVSAKGLGRLCDHDPDCPITLHNALMKELGVE